MRITQLLLSKGFGGAERYFVDLALALAEAGHEVQALCHERFVGRTHLGPHPRLRVDAVRSGGLWDMWSVRRMIRLLADFGPEVIQAHLARGAWAAGHVGRRLDVPVVVKTHNYVKLKYYRHVDLFIPTTEDQAAYLRAQGVPGERIRCIPNFSSLPAVAAPAALDACPLRFAAYGRMVEKKGFGVLLEAFERVTREGVDARLAIGGEGPLRARLIDRAAELGLADRVRFAGWIEGVAGFLAEADIFVLPSLDEPFGIAVLEAMACGRPVVATRTKGPLEVLDEASAYFAEAGDVGSLATAMRAAARERALSRRKAALCLERYRARFHRDAVVPRIEALYGQLAGARG